MSKKSRFRPVLNCIRAAFTNPPAFTKNKRPRGAKRAGLLFERKVGKMLEGLFPGKVIVEPWIVYEDSYTGERVCAPDYLVIDVRKGLITIVECKLTHTKDAYYQINHVYEPVVRELFPGYDVRGVEVCKNFEACTEYPVKPKIITSLNMAFTGGDNVMVAWGC